MTFLDFAQHGSAEEKKKDKSRSSDAEDIENRKKIINWGLAKSSYTYLAASVLMSRYKNNMKVKDREI